MTFCKSNHGELCRPSTAIYETTLKLSVIDVITRRVVFAKPGCRYVALSYVWAQAGMGESEVDWDVTFADGFLPEKVPQTIEDAILVVKALGERFLWVDAYCIDQTNSQGRQVMIDNMDLIYEGATATICAVTSPSTGSGLPGVSLPWRVEPQVIQQSQTGSFATVRIPVVSMSVVTSLWNHRAWTLQEAVLSKRRLCFSEDQIFLWCQQELFHDVFEHGPSPNHVQTVIPTECDRTAFPLCLGFKLEGEWYFRLYDQIVRTYTGEMFLSTQMHWLQ
jgi:hypothetical protein